MPRSVKKGPFVDAHLVQKVEAALADKGRRAVKTWSRRSTVLPQFVVPTAPLPPQYLAIGATMTVVDVIVMSGYAGLAARLLRWLRTPRQQTALGRTFSGLFATAAVVLSLVRRMTPA